MTQQKQQVVKPTLAEVLKPSITKLSSLADSLNNLRIALELPPQKNVRGSGAPT